MVVGLSSFALNLLHLMWNHSNFCAFSFFTRINVCENMKLCYILKQILKLGVFISSYLPFHVLKAYDLFLYVFTCFLNFEACHAYYKLIFNEWFCCACFLACCVCCIQWLLKLKCGDRCLNFITANLIWIWICMSIGLSFLSLCSSCFYNSELWLPTPLFCGSIVCVFVLFSCELAKTLPRSLVA